MLTSDDILLGVFNSFTKQLKDDLAKQMAEGSRAYLGGQWKIAAMHYQKASMLMVTHAELEVVVRCSFRVPFHSCF